MPDYELIDDLRQYHLEDFDAEYWRLKDASPNDGKGRNTDNGIVLRAAMVAGWFGPDYVTDVDKRVKNMRPVEVVRLSTAVNAKYKAITAVDPTLLWQLVAMYLKTESAPPTSPELSGSSGGEILEAAVG